MNHTFNSDMACKVGLNAAIVYAMLRRLPGGKVTPRRIDTSALKSFLPFFSECEIMSAARTLEEYGYIATFSLGKTDCSTLIWRIENNDVKYC